MSTAKVECNACPVLCQISEGRTGACDRYANRDGVLVRVDPVVLLRRELASEAPALVPFARPAAEPAARRGARPTGAAISCTPTRSSSPASAPPPPTPTTSPRPSSSPRKAQGVDMVTVVTEGIFSYCSFKVKIDTDRFLGAEQANVRYQRRGRGPRHHRRVRLADAVARRRAPPHRRQQEGRPHDGRADAAAGQQEAGRMHRSTAARSMVIQAGRAPIVNGVEEQRMRVGCGSATVGIFARQLFGQADEVVVVDDHITGVLTEHQAGRCLDMRALGHPDARAQVDAGALLPGREPGQRLGRHRHRRPAVDHRGLGSGRGAAGPAPADDLHHRRACAVVRARRAAAAASSSRCRPRCAASSSASARTASRRCAPCCSSAAPAAACAPASPRTRCC